MPERMLAQLAEARPEPDDFYEISGTAGIKLLRDDLEKLLQERWDADEEWRNFLKSALPSPAES